MDTRNNQFLRGVKEATSKDWVMVVLGAVFIVFFILVIVQYAHIASDNLSYGETMYGRKQYDVYDVNIIPNTNARGTSDSNSESGVSGSSSESGPSAVSYSSKPTATWLNNPNKWNRKYYREYRGTIMEISNGELLVHVAGNASCSEAFSNTYFCTNNTALMNYAVFNYRSDTDRGMTDRKVVWTTGNRGIVKIKNASDSLRAYNKADECVWMIKGSNTSSRGVLRLRNGRADYVDPDNNDGVMWSTASELHQGFYIGKAPDLNNENTSPDRSVLSRMVMSNVEELRLGDYRVSPGFYERTITSDDGVTTYVTAADIICYKTTDGSGSSNSDNKQPGYDSSSIIYDALVLPTYPVKYWSMTEVLQQLDSTALADLNLTTTVNPLCEETIGLEVTPQGQLHFSMAKLDNGSNDPSKDSTYQTFWNKDTDAYTGRGFPTIAGSLNVLNNGMSDRILNTYVRLVDSGAAYGGDGPALLFMASVVKGYGAGDTTSGDYTDKVLCIIDENGITYTADFPESSNTTQDPATTLDAVTGHIAEGPRCAASHSSVNPDHKVCCGQSNGTGDILSSDYICSSAYPFCVDYIANAHYGYCVKMNDT